MTFIICSKFPNGRPKNNKDWKFVVMAVQEPTRDGASVNAVERGDLFGKRKTCNRTKRGQPLSIRPDLCRLLCDFLPSSLVLGLVSLLTICARINLWNIMCILHLLHSYRVSLCLLHFGTKTCMIREFIELCEFIAQSTIKASDAILVRLCGNSTSPSFSAGCMAREVDRSLEYRSLEYRSTRKQQLKL